MIHRRLWNYFPRSTWADDVCGVKRACVTQSIVRIQVDLMFTVCKNWIRYLIRLFRVTKSFQIWRAYHCAKIKTPSSVFFLILDAFEITEWYRFNFLRRKKERENGSVKFAFFVDLICVFSFLSADERTKTALPSFTNTNDTLTNRSLWPCTIDNAQRMCVLCVLLFFFSRVARFSFVLFFAAIRARMRVLDGFCYHSSSPFQNQKPTHTARNARALCVLCTSTKIPIHNAGAAAYVCVWMASASGSSFYTVLFVYIEVCCYFFCCSLFAYVHIFEAQTTLPTYVRVCVCTGPHERYKMFSKTKTTWRWSWWWWWW